MNSSLQAKMRGFMSAYRVSCARMVVNAVKARGLHSRAAVIAITTTIVESSIDNISEELDHDSLGLFQQRASWGNRTQRLDPTWATNAFLNKMLNEYPNNTWMTAPVGEVCQTVQVSAFPERYQPQAGDGQIIVNALWSV
ncbi:hypothetical protein HKK74_38930, partial [Actinomadura alba]|nr:hypothetical protein [Actinomadura alba]